MNAFGDFGFGLGKKCVSFFLARNGLDFLNLDDGALASLAEKTSPHNQVTSSRSISPLDVIFKPVAMRGFFLGHPEFAAKLAPAVVQAAEMIAASRLHVPVAGTYPLSSIKEAITHAQRGGKILLDIAGSST